MDQSTQKALDQGYQAMAADLEREAEAVEWCNAVAGDMADVERIEDMEDYNAAVDAMERLRKGEETLYSAAEVKRILGLED